MVAPARKISSSPGIADTGLQKPMPANDNASSLRGASLRVLQGGQSSAVKKNRNQPTLHPLSDAQMARNLEDDQMRDRSHMEDGSAGVSDDTLKEGSTDSSEASVLDLEPQSYTNREETPEKSWAKSQRKEARAAARFLNPDASSSMAGSEEMSSGTGQRAMRGTSRRPDRQQASPSNVASRLMAMQAADAREEEDDAAATQAGGMLQGLTDVKDLEQEGRRLWTLMIKIFETASVLMAIWVIICLNIETLNILLIRKKAPEWINRSLNLIGLNLDVDPNHPWSPTNLLVVYLTLFIDFIFGLLIGMQICLMLFTAYWIIQAGSVLTYVVDFFNYMGLSF
jgi:hypothetical protein